MSLWWTISYNSQNCMASMFMIILIHEALFVLLIPSFPERKGWITLVCSQLDVFFNYHFLIACVHLIHWLITMGSVWSLDLVYIVFPKHGQILWSCGGRKALVFWGFFLHSWIWRISKQFFIKQVLLYSWNDEVKYHFKKATFLIFWKLFKWQW